MNNIELDLEYSTGIVQEHVLGCAVACVAFRCVITYQNALKLFDHPESAWTRGYYCEEILSALKKAGLDYLFIKFNPLDPVPDLRKNGTMVYVKPNNSRYPEGHFLIRAEQGWMNPWSNYPRMHPAESDFEETLPGEIGFIIYQTNLS